MILGALLIPPWLVASRAEEALQAALPGLRCRPAGIHLASARRSWSGSEYLTGSIGSSASCRAEIEQQVTTTGRFVPATCNAVERCWKSRVNGAELTFTFHEDWVHYSYDRQSD